MPLLVIFDTPKNVIQNLIEIHNAAPLPCPFLLLTLIGALLQKHSGVNMIFYSSENLKPSKTKSPSKPGCGKWALMQLTTQDERGTLSLYQVHPNTTLQVEYKQHVFLFTGPTNAFVPYYCLYCFQAVCSMQWLWHSASNQGLSVIQPGIPIFSTCATS